MNILITGVNGFLGKILKNNFIDAGHQVSGLARSDADMNVDLRHDVPDINQKYDLVIHAAGKAHLVPSNENEMKAFYEVNVKGTENFLRGLENAAHLPGQLVFISSVSVYGLEEGQMISETQELNGETPYARSKIAAEKKCQEWAAKMNVPLLILRLPLIVGPNAPGNLGAMVNAIRKGFYFNVGNRLTKKSLVLAEDIAQWLLSLPKSSGIYHLSDQYDPTMAEIETWIAQSLHKKNPRSLPNWLINILSKMGDLLGPKFPLNSLKVKKLSLTLTFSSEKASRELGWKPQIVIHKKELI
jgi:nucleoside-diphosphate-sugar epimerase